MGNGDAEVVLYYIDQDGTKSKLNSVKLVELYEIKRGD